MKPEPGGATLQWTETEGRSERLALDRIEIVVGRHSKCDLVIPHDSISRQHAKVLCSEGEYLLVDLASINGTFVNGQRVQACLLRTGDRIQFAKSPNPIYFEHGPRSSPKLVNSSPYGGLPPERVSDLLQAELRKSVEHRWDLDKELRLAEEIQEALLPQRFPKIDGFRVCAHSMPTRYVGGDFYDFIAPSAENFIGVLGDVSGKGVAASLLSSMVLGCLDTQLRSNVRLEDALPALNELLREKGCGRFVTLFLLQLHSNGQGRFVSAGHNPAYIYRARAGRIIEVSSNGPIVGAFESCSFQSEAIALETGDVMLVYSDGLTDAEDDRGEMFGEDRVKRVLQHSSPGGPECVKASLIDVLHEFTEGQSQIDDITFIVLQRA
jgi:serine phosphatase RsbU (regulator of sigma subunit)